MRLIGPVLNDTSRQAIDELRRGALRPRPRHRRDRSPTRRARGLAGARCSPASRRCRAEGRHRRGDRRTRCGSTAGGSSRALDQRVATDLADEARRRRRDGRRSPTTPMPPRRRRQAVRPRPEICADQIAAILDVGLDPVRRGSAEIAPGAAASSPRSPTCCAAARARTSRSAATPTRQGTPDGNRAAQRGARRRRCSTRCAQDLPRVRLTARGYGADEPVADNASEAGRAKNRRIEFTLVAPEGARRDAAATGTARRDPTTRRRRRRAPRRRGAAPRAHPATPPAPRRREDRRSSRVRARLGDDRPRERAVVDLDRRGARAPARTRRIEVGGYTDAQGSESGNLRLGQARAEAVLAALRGPDLPLPAHDRARLRRGRTRSPTTAPRPGRQQNRRIAFTVARRPGGRRRRPARRRRRGRRRRPDAGLRRRRIAAAQASGADRVRRRAPRRDAGEPAR